MSRLTLLFTVAVLLGADEAYGLTCRSCREVDCEVPTQCKYGLVKDVCGCCNVCAQGRGESCQGTWGILGKCGEGYVCDTSNGANEMPPGYPENFLPGVCIEDPQVALVNGPRANYGRPRGSVSSGLLGSGRRSGQAKKMAKTHRYNVYGSSIPSDIAALLASQKGGRRRKRALLGNSRRAGSAKLQAKKHKHKVSGGIPPEYAALLEAYRKQKARGKRALLRWMDEALNREA